MKEKFLGADAAAGQPLAPQSMSDAASHAAPKRPRHWSKEVREDAAAKIADELIAENTDYEANSREQMIRDLREVIGFRDGYEIARSLERHGWDPDRELVEKLDGGFHLHNAYDAAVKTWVVRNCIMPEFKVGDRVVFNGYRGRDYSQQVPIEGEIARIEGTMARYLVFVESEGHVRNGLGTHGTYVDFENVRRAVAGSGAGCDSTKAATAASASAEEGRSR